MKALSVLRPFRRLAGDDGVMVVMFAFSLVALMGFTAIVFDVAAIYEERRQLQNAADGAALAAARELPGSPTNAAAAAEAYLAANGYTTSDADVSATVVTPYSGDDEYAEVTVTKLDKPYLFGRLLGLTDTDVSARAVGQIVSAYGDEYAIFAIDSSCGADGVSISGSLASFTGTVHGNADVTVSGSDHTFDPAVTYQCDFTENGSGHTYERGQKNTGARDVPSFVSGIDATSFGACAFSYPNNVNLKSKAEVWQDPGKTILIDGVYCFDRNVSLVGNDIVGNVTFVALGHIDVSGSGHDLTAYDPTGILFYSESSTGNNQIDIAGSGGSWTGLIYAPNGDASISGQGNHNWSGSVVAQNVDISGNGMSITASHLAANGNPVVRIAE